MRRDYPELDLARYIDHALLNPTATSEQVERCCHEAIHFQFPAVCVYATAVRQAREILQGKKTKICSVIGFPSGATTSAVKLFEAQEAVENGAEELDVMINLGWLKAGKSEEIYREIAQICEETGQTIKVILETNVLTKIEKRLAAEIAMDAGASFLKTGTGWFGGATVEDVKLLHKLTKGRVGIKASGGIRTLDQALELIEAGATRLGTSRGPDLIHQRENQDSQIDESDL
jgi:deoxyribose-phosphate aldolase